MTINCIGRVNVPTPGTPVPLSTNPTRHRFQAVLPGYSRADGQNLCRRTHHDQSNARRGRPHSWPNATGGFSENFYIESQDGENSIRLADYAIDADVAGEGLLVTYWTE